MPWVKIDDGFYDNPTNRQLGPAREVFIAGLCYCAKGLTDGRIAKSDVPLILAQAQAKPSMVKRLVDAGRWIDRGDWYEVDAYLDYQLSRERVLADRAADRERKRRQRERGSFKSPNGSHGVTPPVTPGRSHTLPDPTRPPTYLHPVVSPGTPADPPTPDRDEAVYEPPKIAPECQAAAREGIALARRTMHPTLDEPA